MCHSDIHQPVVRRVVFDLVDTVTVPIVRAQYRLVPVGEFTPSLSFLTGSDGAQFEGLVGAPATTFADKRLRQRRVGRRVVSTQERNLIDHLMRIGHGYMMRLDEPHGCRNPHLRRCAHRRP